MSPLMAMFIVLGIVLIACTVFLVRKHRTGWATLAGIAAGVLLAAALYLTVVEKPYKYAFDQTKETYQEMLQDQSLAFFRIVVDGIIVNKFPEWNDDTPFEFRIDYTNSAIYITTKQ